MNERTLDSRTARLVLNALPHMGPVTLRRLLDHFDDDPVAVLAADSNALMKVRDVGPAVTGAIREWRKHFNLERELAQLDSIGGCFLVPQDEEYPPLLRNIYDPPIALYWLGKYTVDRPCVAIIGTRGCTLYGSAVAKELGRQLAQSGFCIVSGMARGIDRAAHEGALEGGGPTLAVFGNGLDIIYPPENVDLYRAIREQGAVVSEFPFRKKANRTTFPMRNRVVSGICEAVIVVETDVAGGSMITARFAAEHDRQVFAVPGRIDQPSSRGCLQLIKDGAVMVTGVEDILTELGYRTEMKQMGLFTPGQASPEGRQTELSAEETAVVGCFAGGESLDRDRLADLTGLDSGRVNATLMLLELKRMVVKRADGSFERKPQ